MDSYLIQIGLFFNAIISGIVALTAAALAIFLLRRWPRLSLPMKAYGWFWSMTALVWLPVSIRYFLISGGGTGPAIFAFMIATQIAVAASGPPLLLYLCAHLKTRKLLAIILPVFVTILGAISIWVDLQPGGILMQPITSFSAEISLNPFSFTIFLSVVAVIFILAVYDIILNLAYYRRQQNQQLIYEALYSTVIVIYLIMGSVEEAGIISGWLVIIFRSLYVATFLFVYIIMDKSETAVEDYLVSV